MALEEIFPSSPDFLTTLFLCRFQPFFRHFFLGTRGKDGLTTNSFSLKFLLVQLTESLEKEKLFPLSLFLLTAVQKKGLQSILPRPPFPSDVRGDGGGQQTVKKDFFLEKKNERFLAAAAEAKVILS